MQATLVRYMHRYFHLLCILISSIKTNLAVTVMANANMLHLLENINATGDYVEGMKMVGPSACLAHTVPWWVWFSILSSMVSVTFNLRPQGHGWLLFLRIPCVCHVTASD